MPQFHDLNERTIREMAKALKNKALVYRSSGNQKMFAAARRAARQLEKWWQAGASGECPVEFERFGMEDYAALCAEAQSAGVEEGFTGDQTMPQHGAHFPKGNEERTFPDKDRKGAEPVIDEDVTLLQEEASSEDEEATILVPTEEAEGDALSSPEAEAPSLWEADETARNAIQEGSSSSSTKSLEEGETQRKEAEPIARDLPHSPLESLPEEQDAAPAEDTEDGRVLWGAPQKQPAGDGHSKHAEVPGLMAPSEPLEREPAAEERPAAPAPSQTEEMEAQRRASRLREVRDALRAGKYEEALRLAKVELTEVGLKPEERQALETLRDEAQDGLIEHWMTRANEAYHAKRWEEALKWARKVLSLDEKHEGAQRLRQEVEPELERQSALQRAETVRQKVEQMLAQLEKGAGVDIRAMEALVREGESLRDAWAEEGLLGTEKGQNFQQALRQLRERFDKKRKQQGQRTTSDAVKSYEAIRVAIPEMEAALRRGEEAWWEDRSGSFRPIVELLDEFRGRLPELAREVALRHAKKAQAALAVHHPQKAIEELEQALTLDGLPSDVRADLEALEVKVKAELTRWERAAKLLEEARGLQDPIERWKKVLQAEKAYSHHEKLVEAKEQAHEDLMAWAAQYISDALVDARALLQNEQFKEARRAVGNMRHKLTGLGLYEEDWSQLWQRVETFEQDIQDAEEHREAIDEQAERIRDLLREGEISQAYQIYKEALERHPDWENDRVFGPLGRELRAKLGDREKVQEGWRLFERGYWEEAREAVKGISSDELQGEIQRLENAVAVAETLAAIEEAWQSGYYRDALTRIEGVLAARGASIAEEDRERLQRYKAEIEERRKGDREVWLQLGKVGLRSADTLTNAKAFADVFHEFPDGVEGLESALQMYRAIQSALAKPSTLEGYLRDAEEQIGAWIRKQVREVVEQLAEEGGWAEVKKWLDVVRNYWPHLDHRWRDKYYRAYFEHRAHMLEQEKAWDELVDMWLEAQSVLPGAFEFVQREKEARREKMLTLARRLLLTAQPGVPAKVIETLESDREVWDDAAQAVYHLAQRLHDLDGLLQRGQIEGVRAFAEELLNEWEEAKAGHRIFSRSHIKEILDKRFTIAAQALLKEGDEAREDDPGTALIAYARGLQLPLPQAEQNILQRRLQAFGHLGERYVKELAQALNRAEVDPSVPLKQQYEEIKRQRQQAWALLGVLPFLVTTKENVGQWEKALQEGLRRAEAKVKALEAALGVLQRYDESGQTWVALLRSGQWDHAQQEIERVQRALGVSHPEIGALQDKLERMEGYRKELENLREKVDLAYRSDRFDEGLQSIKTIRDRLAQLDTTPTEEPFGVVQNMRLFDAETGKMVRGLDEIQRLLEHRWHNLEAWKQWAAFLQHKVEQLRPQVEELQTWGDDIPPTAKEVEGIEKALANCEKVIEKAISERPAEEPLSDAAKKVKTEGESALQKLQEWREWLKARHGERWRDMAAVIKEAQELVDMGNFAEAAEVIDAGLYYQPEHEFLQYLADLIAQLQEEEAKRASSFLGRLWRRK